MGIAVTGRHAQPGIAPVPRANRLFPALLALAAFGLYWLSSFVLEARNGTTHFGADTWFYTELARGSVFDRIADNYHLDRIFRFHPTTVVMAAGWMSIVDPLTAWIAPRHLLKAMFAAVGAAGVWAAMSAFAAVLPRRYVTLWGGIYATTLGVWYFSGIEESKIVTPTLTALYLATYLNLRKAWTMRGAALLTAIFMLACLNETVCCFLVIVPMVDTLVQRGWDFHQFRWMAWQALAGLIALAILEGIMRGRTGAAGAHPEGATHFSMLVWYISLNDFTVAALYGFAVRWLFFNIAAPTSHASYWTDPSIPKYGGDFEPLLANYLSSPVSVGLVALFGVLVVASLLQRHRGESANGMAAILLALLAYTLFRGLFFFILNNRECLLYSPGVTLTHMLLIAIPFGASRFPAKGLLLLVLAVLLLLNNGAFILGSDALRFGGGAFKASLPKSGTASTPLDHRPSVPASA
jgi:hypothetical protein